MWFCLTASAAAAYIATAANDDYKAVSGGGPGFDLGPKNAYFWETYFKDQNSDTEIFKLITKI